MRKFTLDRVRELGRDATVGDAARALDADVPGWEQKVDLEILDMGNGRCCVAGQVARSWRTRGGASDGYGRFLDRIYEDGYIEVPRVFSSDQRRRPAWARAIKARLAKGTK